MTSATHIYTVYKITNKINNYYYISIHREQPNEALYAYMGSGTAIKDAIKEEGIENFVKEILHRYDNAEEMKAKEAELVTMDIVESRECYNLQTGGGHGIPSEEAKEKMRGENSSMYGRTGENHPRYGKPGTFKDKKHTKESLEMMREKKRGENNPMYGKPSPMKDKKHSKKTREKMSESQRGKKHTKESLEKMRGRPSPMKGKKHTKKSLEKMSESQRGRKHTKESLEKMREKARGRKLPKVTCPHCDKTGDVGNMKRWHFDNCGKLDK